MKKERQNATYLVRPQKCCKETPVIVSGQRRLLSRTAHTKGVFKELTTSNQKCYRNNGL